jgi:hypothetical protein
MIKKKNRRGRQDVSEAPKDAIFEEVETFEELAPRLHELLLTSPKGTKVYVHVRDRRSVH